ncbi:transposase [Oceanobacter antarcticus]|uniref:transposase n=1 Tax=Oceanobacter antarcticus TaxID=3133425 RepID=UPI003A0FF3A7
MDSHRMSTVEPVFANIEYNKGLKRFSLRGKRKCKRSGNYSVWCTILRSGHRE